AGVHDLIDEVAQASGATVVVVTHNEALAERMPRRLVLKDGRVSA
ncbi:MAG: lipoprotein-releasing system ATP-binding protein LolD, partial [Candidatus Dadabacteria bacterium]